MNGERGIPSSSVSTICAQFASTVVTVGGVGTEISPPGSLLFIILCLTPGCRPSNRKTSIPDLLANSLATCPQLKPGMLGVHAKACQLIGGGAGRCS